MAIEQRQFFSSSHPDAVQGFPRFLNADGSGSPVFAPLQGGQNALVLGDGNGYVHAMNGNKNGKGSKVGKKSKAANTSASIHSWAGTGGKGSTSSPGGWTPGSLSATGSRFAKK